MQIYYCFSIWFRFRTSCCWWNFWAINYPSVEPMMGVLVGLKAFAAAVVGGIGSVTGAVVGGFIIGFTEVVVIAFFPELGWL